MSKYRIKTEPDWQSEPRYVSQKKGLFFWHDLSRADTQAGAQKSIDSDIKYYAFKREIIKVIKS